MFLMLVFYNAVSQIYYKKHNSTCRVTHTYVSLVVNVRVSRRERMCERPRVRMCVMDAFSALIFCPKENIFFFESDWSFLRTKRSFPSDKILA